MEKIKIGFQGKEFNINVKKFSGIDNFTSGLMFTKREKARALLFDFRKPEKFSFTSLFVFFPFLILWLDKENNVLGMKKINPFQWHIPSEKSYYRVLEIPFNDDYKEIISILVDRKDL